MKKKWRKGGRDANLHHLWTSIVSTGTMMSGNNNNDNCGGSRCKHGVTTMEVVAGTREAFLGFEETP